MILPLSTHSAVALFVATCESSAVQSIPERLVKELNRRIASGAERFVFYHKDADWIPQGRHELAEQLNRIRWT